MTDNINQLVDIIARRVMEKLEDRGIRASSLSPQTSSATQSCCSDSCGQCGHCVAKNHDGVHNIIQMGASRISTRPGIDASSVDSQLAGMIDHTILKPEATREQLLKVCQEAKQYHFATVCVNSSNVALVARELKGSGVKAIAVVGFPLGAATAQSKAFEAKQAIHDGAEEIDMVINIGALKSKNYKTVYNDIVAVVEASKPYPVKVILETSDLTNDEKIAACVLSKTAGAAFVKTSTGFASGGATVEDIELMRRVVGNDMQVKASGGIRSKEDAEKMIKAGANRIGASASVAIVTGKSAGGGKY